MPYFPLLAIQCFPTAWHFLNSFPEKWELYFQILARILTVHFSITSSNMSPSYPPLHLTSDLFLRYLQPQHFQGLGCTSRMIFSLYSGPARILGESLMEVALPCSEGHWWHTCTDLLSPGELVMQSVAAGQLVWAWVFNLVCSSLGSHLRTQIFCYKLYLQVAFKTCPVHPLLTHFEHWVSAPRLLHFQYCHCITNHCQRIKQPLTKATFFFFKPPLEALLQNRFHEFLSNALHHSSRLTIPGTAFGESAQLHSAHYIVFLAAKIVLESYN